MVAEGIINRAASDKAAPAPTGGQILGQTKTIGLKHYVMVAIPSYGGAPCVEMTESLLLAQLHCFQRGVLLDIVPTVGFSLVHCARNYLTAQFLKSKKYDLLLWLDDDLCFSPDGIMKLIESDKDVVGGVYTTKVPDVAQRAFAYFPADDASVVDGVLQRADKLPGGFMMLKRNVVEKIATNCDWYWLPHDGGEHRIPHVFDTPLVPAPDKGEGELRMLGEDFVLCQRALEAGFEVWARTDIGFGHFGRYMYAGKLSDSLKAEAAAKAEGGA